MAEDLPPSYDDTFGDSKHSYPEGEKPPPAYGDSHGDSSSTAGDDFPDRRFLDMLDVFLEDRVRPWLEEKADRLTYRGSIILTSQNLIAKSHGSDEHVEIAEVVGFPENERKTLEIWNSHDLDRAEWEKSVFSRLMDGIAGFYIGPLRFPEELPKAKGKQPAPLPVRKEPKVQTVVENVCLRTVNDFGLYDSINVRSVVIRLDSNPS